MPARRNRGNQLPQIPASLSLEVGNKSNKIEELHNECKQIQEQNEKIQKEIDDYEKESLKIIQQYRAQIDEKSTTINMIKHKIDDLYTEKNSKIKELNDENEARKQKVFEEDKQLIEDIEAKKAALEVIRQFEIDKESIAKDIQEKEAAIENEKKKHEENVENQRRMTKEASERAIKQTEEKLQQAKEDYYDLLLSQTDPAVLLHIQRRNNYENDLFSLQNMFTDYSEKIRAREEGNAKLRETIEQLKRDELIQRSADQKQNISTLRLEVNAARQQLNTLVTRSKADREQSEVERQEEAKKIELALKLQQDQLDHKLQQIAALRELTLKVLSFRSQLEAEFITVLGEMIYDVAQRENPGQKTIQSRATRKLSMASSSASSQQSQRISFRNKEFSINHVLAQFTLDDRLTCLQRFMERVQGGVEESDRAMSPLLNDDDDGTNAQKPSSV